MAAEQCWVFLVRTRRDAAVVEAAVAHTWMERGEMGEARQHVSTCMVGVKARCCTAEGESRACDETVVSRVME